MVLQDEDYHKRYTVLSELTIDLDGDPVANGLQSLTEKLAALQALRNRVGSALGEALRNKTEAEMAFKSVEHDRDTTEAALMSQNNEVKGQKSDKMREATAQTLMSDLLLKMHHAEVALMKADTYFKYVERLNDTLEAANQNLSRQISVVQMSINLKELDNNYYPDRPIALKPTN